MARPGLVGIREQTSKIQNFKLCLKKYMLVMTLFNILYSCKFDNIVVHDCLLVVLTKEDLTKMVDAKTKQAEGIHQQIIMILLPHKILKNNSRK